MGKESQVEIKGHQYRYEYDEGTQKTLYRGPVGDAPALGEEEFFQVMEKKGNYIHTLEGTVNNQEEQLRTIRDQIVEIKNYLQSDKFTSEGRDELQNYVNTSDMLLRLDEIWAGIHVPNRPQPRISYNQKTEEWEVQVPKSVGGGPTFKGYDTVYKTVFKENAEHTFELWKEPRKYQFVLLTTEGEKVLEEGYYTQPQLTQLKADVQEGTS